MREKLILLSIAIVSGAVSATVTVLALTAFEMLILK